MPQLASLSAICHEYAPMEDDDDMFDTRDIPINGPEEFAAMRKAGALAATILDELTEAHRKVENLVDVRRETIILRTCGTLLEDGTHCESKLKLRDWLK